MGAGGEGSAIGSRRLCASKWWDEGTEEHTKKKRNLQAARSCCVHEKLSDSETAANRSQWLLWNGGIAACCLAVLCRFQIYGRQLELRSWTLLPAGSENGVGSSALLISLVPLLLALISTTDAAISCRLDLLHTEMQIQLLFVIMLPSFRKHP